VKHETKTTQTETETNTPTANWYIAELDRLVDLPQNEKQDDRYLDLILRFYVDHPDEATSFLKPILPKVKTFSNKDARVLSQLCANAFEGASFPYLGFAKNSRVPAQAVRDWYTQTVFPAAAIAWMKQQFGKLVYAGVWTHLKGQEDLCKGTDLAEEVEACSNLVWTWAARPENALSLMKDREVPSRIGSRLKARAALNVGRTWKTLALRAKQKEPVIVAVDDLEQKPVKGARSVVLGGTPVEEQKTKTTAMYCGPCDSLKPVVSEAEDALHLACGHSRSISSPGIASAK
jgi:hypothetical protein